LLSYWRYQVIGVQVAWHCRMANTVSAAVNETDGDRRTKVKVMMMTMAMAIMFSVVQWYRFVVGVPEDYEHPRFVSA
jgi:heme/copper-type cytochrome/quinol oxidase subunit 3